jgi:hypothetical protein
VRAWKQRDRTRATHELESAEGWKNKYTERNQVTEATYFLESEERRTSEDTDRMRAGEGHSLAGEHRPTDKLGHVKKVAERGGLTCYSAQTDGQVRTQKESSRARGTHLLESADRTDK